MASSLVWKKINEEEKHRCIFTHFYSVNEDLSVQVMTSEEKIARAAEHNPSPPGN